MRINFTNGKLIVCFTLNFIIHQILLFLFTSLPAVFYITVLKQPLTPMIIHLTTGLIFAAYLLYCLFYGYYVARPMAGILMRINRLPSGEYLMPAQKKRYRSFSSRHIERFMRTWILSPMSCGKTSESARSSSNKGRIGRQGHA